MRIKQITEINYQYGQEDQIILLLYNAKEPILLKINNFTNEFSLNYFEKHINAKTSYSRFENDQFVEQHTGDFATTISDIKKNKPYRIFAQFLHREESMEIEKHVPLWQMLPFRPKYFLNNAKVVYFFGGKGSQTGMHFDREQCCLLHLCLSGKKRVLLVTEEQSDLIYKVPFISDSLIDFSQPLDELRNQFPRINQAEGYDVLLEKGDMLFMPKNCWHYTSYLDAAASATYAFYPKKILQIYGYFTGYFYFGYIGPSGFGIAHWPIVKKFSEHYARATGKKKQLLKLIESIAFIIMLPIVSIGYRIFKRT
jgi:hypothetical protein